MSHDITLSTWGDIGNIILGISSLSQLLLLQSYFANNINFSRNSTNWNKKS